MRIYPLISVWVCNCLQALISLSAFLNCLAIANIGSGTVLSSKALETVVIAHFNLSGKEM